MFFLSLPPLLGLYFCRRCCMRFSARVPDHTHFCLWTRMLMMLVQGYDLSASVTAVCNCSKYFCFFCHCCACLQQTLADAFCLCHYWACLQQTLSAPATAVRACSSCFLLLPLLCFVTAADTHTCSFIPPRDIPQSAFLRSTQFFKP